MKKRVVKLNSTQLRGLIKEAIQSREPGSPLWSAPAKKKVVRESNLENDLSTTLADMVQDSWEKFYDDDDPSMQHTGGKQAWDQQVTAATEEFAARVNDLIEEIETRLVAGRFYFGGR